MVCSCCWGRWLWWGKRVAEALIYRKQKKNKELETSYKPSQLPPVTYFLQVGLSSQASLRDNATNLGMGLCGTFYNQIWNHNSLPGNHTLPDFFLGYKCGIEAERSYLLISWKPGVKETELTFYVYFIMLSVHQGLCILYLSGSVIKYI